MGPTDDVDKAAKASPLYAKYGTRVESQSARELLAARIEQASQPAAADGKGAAPTAQPEPQERHKAKAAAVTGGAAVLASVLNSTAGRQLEREVVRGVFGLLKKSLAS